MTVGVLKFFKWIPNIKEPYTLFLVMKDPRTPLHSRLCAFSITGMMLVYIVSPIGSFPVLGWMSDLILFPLGIMLAEKFLPQDILLEKRVEAHKRVNRVLWRIAIGVVVFIALWALIITVSVMLIIRLIHG